MDVFSDSDSKSLSYVSQRFQNFEVDSFAGAQKLVFHIM